MEQKINLLNTLWLYFLSDGIELVKKDGNLLNEEEKMIILPVHDKSRRTIKSELKKAGRKYDKIFLATTDKAEFKSLKNQFKKKYHYIFEGDAFGFGDTVLVH